MKASARMSAVARSGYAAAQSVAISAQSQVPKMAARRDPAASNTARMSSVNTSNGGMSVGEKRSEQPKPRRSVMMTRA
jgi:hypothetical protein